MPRAPVSTGGGIAGVIQKKKTRRQAAAGNVKAQKALTPRGSTYTKRWGSPASTPVKQAAALVDRHVKIDKQGFPSLLPSSIAEIAKPTKLAAPPTVSTLSDNDGHPDSLDTNAEFNAARKQARIDLGLTTPKEKRQDRHIDKIVGQGVKRQRKQAAKLTRHATTPTYRRTETGGAYAFDMGLGAKGAPFETRKKTPVDPYFNTAGTVLQYAPFGATTAAGRLGLRAALSAAGRKEAKDLGAKGLLKQGLPRISSAAKGVSKIPAAVKAAPGAARRAPAVGASIAATSAGRREAAATAGRAVSSHKAITGLALGEAAHKSGADIPGAKQVGAFVEGTTNAVVHHGPQTAKTTLRVLPGAIAAPVGLAASAAESAFSGSLDPLKKEAQTQFEGTVWRKGSNKKGHEKRGLVEALVSGNPKVVEKTTAEKAGLAMLPLLPAVTRTKGYKGIRSDVRGAAASARRKSEPFLRETGSRVRPRVSPKGVERPVFSFAEKRQSGMRLMKHRGTAEGPFQMAAAEHGKAILHAAGSMPKKYKEAGVQNALQTLLSYGIRDQKGVEYARQHGPTSETVPEGAVNLKRALDTMADHPEMWNDKAVRKFIKTGERAAETTPAQMQGIGEVARLGEQAAAHRHRYHSEKTPVPHDLQDPRIQVPTPARKLTKAATREEAWADLQKREATPNRSKTQKARDKKLRDALDPYTRPDQSQDFATTKRVPWDEPMMRAHVNAVEAENRDVGLASARWTHHAPVREAGAGLGEMQYPRPPGNKEHSRGAADSAESLAGRDMIDRSLSAFIKGTVEMPRRRAGGKAFAKAVAEHEVGTRYPVRVNREVKNTVRGEATGMLTRDEYAKATAPKTKENPDGGQYDRNSMGFFPYDQVKNALEDPFTKETDFQAIIDQAASHDSRGHAQELGFMLPRHQIEEWRSAIQGDLSKVSNFLAGTSRIATAGLLGTNPAWAMTQVVAEGVPAVLAHPELLLPHKVPSIEMSLSAMRKTNPEMAHKFEGIIGGSSSRASAIKQASDTTGGYGQVEAPNPTMLAEEGRILTRGKAARALDSITHLRPLRTFDVRRQREYRAVLAVAEADKRFRSFRSGLKKTISREETVAGKFRGKSRQEMFEWLTNTKEGQREMLDIRKSLDDVFGNWDAFTKLERELAPWTIFYPFLRYAVTWPLWTFPRSHPITAEIAYFLAQQNSNRLEQILGQDPATGSEFLYALPVFTSAEKKDNGDNYQAVLPAGSRISPGQSVIQGALMSKNPSQVLGSLNPFIGAWITGTTGTTPFGSQTTQPKGWAAANQLLPGLSALRYTGVTPQRAANVAGANAKDPLKSVLSEAFDRLDPHKDLRGFAAPFLPTSAAKVKQKNRLSAALAVAKENGKDAREDVGREAAGRIEVAKSEKEKARIRSATKKKTAQMAVKASNAGDIIDKILTDVGLQKKNERMFKEQMELSGGSSGGSSSSGSPKPTTTTTTVQGGQVSVKTSSGTPKKKDPAMVNAAYVTGQKKPPPQVPGTKVVGAFGNTPQTVPPKSTQPSKDSLKNYLADPKAVQFGEELSKRLGLNPRVVATWLKAEGGHGGSDYNYLNLGTGLDSGFNSKPEFQNPKSAAQATAGAIKRGDYGAAPEYAVLGKLRGKTDAQQLKVLGSVGWAGSPSAPNPAYPGLLENTYNSLPGGSKTVMAPGQATRAIKWADKMIGTTEGSKPWAGSPSLPWCSLFVTQAMKKAGVKDMPANPAYSGTWLDWSGGTKVKDPKKARPGDIVVFDWGDGGRTDHVGLYVGDGKMIAGNNSNNAVGVSDVDTSALVGIVRPKYRGKMKPVEVGGLSGGELASIGGSSGGGASFGGASSGNGGGSSSSSTSASTFKAPDYVGLKSGSSAISSILGITGSKTGTDVSAPALLANLPKMPTVKRQRSRR